MLADSLSYMFAYDRALKLVKNSVNLTNSINPLQITKNITLTIFNCCAPLPFRLAAHCIVVSAMIASSLASPNLVTIGSAIYLVSEIYENC